MIETLEEEIAAGLVEVATRGDNIIVEMLSSANNQPIANTQAGMSNIVPQEMLEVAKKVSDLKQEITSSITVKDASNDKNRLADSSSPRTINLRRSDLSSPIKLSKVLSRWSVRAIR